MALRKSKHLNNNILSIRIWINEWCLRIQEKLRRDLKRMGRNSTQSKSEMFSQIQWNNKALKKFLVGKGVLEGCLRTSEKATCSSGKEGHENLFWLFISK